MVCHATNFQGRHFILAGDAAEKWPEPPAEVRRDEWSPFFGAENAMEIGADVGHAGVSAAPAGLVNLQFQTRS